MSVVADVTPGPCSGARTEVRLQAVVAVPVRNEAERIGACLDALDGQAGCRDGELGILLFLNNCSDATAAIVAGRRLRCPIRVVERRSADANAGWARREAMEAAADWLDDEGKWAGSVILTTDADSRVPHDWVARNLAAIASGADAVAGRVTLDAEEAARLPARLHARGRLEGEYEALLTELSARLDPLPHDPWPCHATASGASLAVLLSTYRRVGGMPALPVGEDRAFERQLLAHGARLRHAPDIAVVTSGRLDGRAPGGVADTMRLRCELPDSPCDPKLEPVLRALFRSGCRRWLRRSHESGRLPGTRAWAWCLAVPPARAAEIAAIPAAGELLAAVEDASPRLRYRPVRPRRLPVQIRLARLAVSALRARGRALTVGRALIRRLLAAPGDGPSRHRGRGGSGTVGSEGAT